MDITLGLDFGTHQSKLCLSYMPNNDTVHEFVEFLTPEGEVTTLFPSVIQVNEDDTIGIGFVDDNHCKGVLVPKPIMNELPEEPSVMLPDKPHKSYPPKPKVVEQDWKEKLMAISNGKDKNKIAQEEWIQTCAKVDYDYTKQVNSWKQKCDTILETHAIWQKKVDSIRSDYAKVLSAWENKNKRCLYFKYFKLSSFSANYPWNKDNPIGADILSVWYLTYLMLYVKRMVFDKFNEKFEDSIAVQMGVPSGVNTIHSEQIKKQAYKLLVAARELMEFFSSPEDFCQTDYHELLSMTVLPTTDIYEKADNYGFFVLPEAFAGLQSLTNRKRLSQGKMHLLVDIGGGTTDIAFFTINEDLTPDIHTMNSFHKGLNYVFESFCEENKGFSISDAQELFTSDRSLFEKGLTLYRNELSTQLNRLVEKIKREYYKNMSNVKDKMGISKLTKAMNGCPIVYCGGGSLYKEMRVRTEYFTDERLVDKNTLNIPNLKTRITKDDYFTILATAYGLSVPQFEEPKMTDLSKLFANIAINVAAGKTSKEEKTEYGIIDD
ncbi:MAG: hypothetical protein MJZ06_08865 [Bacteroidaceae bacterium]|nr:hypothetical protein [Bacteroidaceae bacterium]